MPIPSLPAIDDMPDLPSDAAQFWIAFIELSGSRESGFDAGPIHYRTITDWLNENGIHDEDERQEYRHFINFIDNLFLKDHRERVEIERNKKKVK